MDNLQTRTIDLAECVANMLAGFPLAHTMTREGLANFIQGSIRLCEGFETDVFAQACLFLARRGGGHVPSGGDIYRTCDRIAAVRKSPQFRNMSERRVESLVMGITEFEKLSRAMSAGEWKG